MWTLSYSLIAPTVLVEGQRALPILRRSRDLVKGQRGKVFLVLLVVNLLQAILAIGVGMVLALLFIETESSGGVLLNSAMNNLMSIFLAPLGIIATILLYYNLRIRKEGFDLEMLSRVVASAPQAMAAGLR